MLTPTTHARRRPVVLAMLLVGLAACTGGRSSADDPSTEDAPQVPTATVDETVAELDALESARTEITTDGTVVTDVGCLRDISAASLEAAFRKRIGPLIGWDNPHIYPLGNRRRLWLVHDSYLDYRGDASTLVQNGPQIQNLAILQERNCFTLIHRGTRRARQNFEPGVGGDGDQAFFWPLGGQLHNGRLKVFWAKMVQSVPRPPPSDGIARHPVSTWLATYDPVTLRRLSFRQAPNSGVFPQYGFAVASDDQFTYLFGNSNLLNFQREGGFFAPFHSATRMYLARVPLGHLGAAPRYRTSRGWSRDPKDAVPISERFTTENTMQPRWIAGRWISVVKVDGFIGTDVVIDVAERPWGPWRTVQRIPHETRYGNDIMTSYQPILLPWLEESGRLGIVISENARVWSEAVANPVLYRPAVFTVPFPPEP